MEGVKEETEGGKVGGRGRGVREGFRTRGGRGKREGFKMRGDGRARVKGGRECFRRGRRKKGKMGG